MTDRIGVSLDGSGDLSEKLRETAAETRKLGEATAFTSKEIDALDRAASRTERQVDALSRAERKLLAQVEITNAALEAQRGRLASLEKRGTGSGTRYFEDGQRVNRGQMVKELTALRREHATAIKAEQKAENDLYDVVARRSKQNRYAIDENGQMIQIIRKRVKATQELQDQGIKSMVVEERIAVLTKEQTANFMKRAEAEAASAAQTKKLREEGAAAAQQGIRDAKELIKSLEAEAAAHERVGKAKSANAARSASQAAGNEASRLARVLRDTKQSDPQSLGSIGKDFFGGITSPLKGRIDLGRKGVRPQTALVGGAIGGAASMLGPITDLGGLVGLAPSIFGGAALGLGILKATHLGEIMTAGAGLAKLHDQLQAGVIGQLTYLKGVARITSALTAQQKAALPLGVAWNELGLKMENSIQSKMLPALGQLGKGLQANSGVLTGAISGGSTSVGSFFSGLGRSLQTRPGQRSVSKDGLAALADQSHEMLATFSAMASAGVRALFAITIAAKPLVDWFSKTMIGVMDRFANWAASGHGQRALADWFKGAEHSATSFMQVIFNLLGIIRGLGKDMAGQGYSILDWLAKVTGAASDWLNGPAGRDKIQAWWDTIKKGGSEAIQTMKDLSKVILPMVGLFLQASGAAKDFLASIPGIGGRASQDALGTVALMSFMTRGRSTRLVSDVIGAGGRKVGGTLLGSDAGVAALSLLRGPKFDSAAALERDLAKANYDKLYYQSLANGFEKTAARDIAMGGAGFTSNAISTGVGQAAGSGIFGRLAAGGGMKGMVGSGLGVVGSALSAAAPVLAVSAAVAGLVVLAYKLTDGPSRAEVEWNKVARSIQGVKDAMAAAKSEQQSWLNLVKPGGKKDTDQMAALGAQKQVIDDQAALNSLKVGKRDPKTHKLILDKHGKPVMVLPNTIDAQIAQLRLRGDTQASLDAQAVYAGDVKTDKLHKYTQGQLNRLAADKQRIAIEEAHASLNRQQTDNFKFAAGPMGGGAMVPSNDITAFLQQAGVKAAGSTGALKSFWLEAAKVAAAIKSIPSAPQVDIAMKASLTGPQTALDIIATLFYGSSNPSKSIIGHHQLMSGGSGKVKVGATGGSVDRPTMFLAGEENKREWVIATNPAYRSKNIEHWAAAGKDLGVTGFATGGATTPLPPGGHPFNKSTPVNWNQIPSSGYHGNVITSTSSLEEGIYATVGMFEDRADRGRLQARLNYLQVVQAMASSGGGRGKIPIPTSVSGLKAYQDALLARKQGGGGGGGRSPVAREMALIRAHLSRAKTTKSQLSTLPGEAQYQDALTDLGGLISQAEANNNGPAWTKWEQLKEAIDWQRAKQIEGALGDSKFWKRIPGNKRAGVSSVLHAAMGQAYGDYNSTLSTTSSGFQGPGGGSGSSNQYLKDLAAELLGFKRDELLLENITAKEFTTAAQYLSTSLGSFATGTGVRGVPHTGQYNLHAGEVVLSRSDVVKMAAGGGGGGQMTITLTGEGPLTSMIAQQVNEKLGQKMRQLVRDRRA